MGDVVVVGGDHVIVAVPGDGDLGDDEGGVVRGGVTSGAWVELGDVLGGFLGLARGDAEVSGDFWEAAFAEGLEVIAEDPVFEAFLAVSPLQLEHEAFAEVAGADAGRVEGLDGPEDGFDLVRGDAGGEGEFVGAGLEVAVVVDVADDHLGDLAVRRAEFGEADLFEEFLLEGGLGDEGIEHELAPFLVLGGGSVGAGASGVLVAPVLVELEEFLEFLVEGVVGGFGWFLGGGIVLDVGRGFGGVGGGRGLGAADLAFLGGFLGDGGFLEDGVLLEFLFDEGLEFEHGSLQQGEGLLELRRQHHLLRHAL